MLFERFDPDLRGATLRFLGDPNDEIRAVALRQLAAEKWPEAVQVLESYLQANGADPERTGSTQEARAGLQFLTRAPAQVVAPFAPPVSPVAPPPPVRPVPEPKPTRGTRLGDD